MAKKNILIKTNNAGAWDELYPITAAGNVKTTDGSDVEAQLMGNRTIDQALTSPSNTGTITKLFSWIVGRIKGITGKNNWYDAPATTIEELNTNRISKTIITAANDFIVGSANATVAKKTLAETKTILGVNGASEAATGVVELATAAETTAGTDSTRAVHPAGLKVELDKKVAAASVQIITGRKTFVAGASGFPLDGTGGQFEVQGNGTDGATILFHRPGVHASYLGLDTDNQLKLGGYSLGASKYKLWHEGNDGAGSGLDADTLDGIQLNALLQLVGGTMQGQLVAQNNTSYTSRQVHNMILSTVDADVNVMQNGDIWIRYV